MRDYSGKRQTSTVTLVWLDSDSTNGFVLNPAAVREEFIRTSGKGGQNRNKVSSCCRLTHIPTGIQVVADSQRHQTQNREEAWNRLTKILETRQFEQVSQNRNQQRVDQLNDEVVWSWNGWRNKVKGNGKKARMDKVLNGKISLLID